MRNIDKIKGLENQNEELRRRIGELQRENKSLDAAIRELQTANNAVMISVVLAHGETANDGSMTLHIPPVNVKDILARWEIHAGKNGDGYFMRVAERIANEHKTN